MRTWLVRLGALLVLVAGASRPAHAEGGKVEADVIYGRKGGMALTMDVIRPAKATGPGLVWIQSGG